MNEEVTPMELADTVELMLSDNPIDRLSAEIHQVGIRHRKLCEYIDKLQESSETVDPLLGLQLKAMEMYGQILIERIVKITGQPWQAFCA